MVPEEGLAPSRLSSFEDAQSALPSAPLRQKWCPWRELHPQGSLFLKQAALLFAVNHKDIRLVRMEGVAPTVSSARWHLSPARLLVAPHPRNKWEHPPGRAPGLLPYQDSPSLSRGWMRKELFTRPQARPIGIVRADYLAVRKGRSARVTTRAVATTRSGRGGRTCTSVAQLGDAFTERCSCCFATPRKSWGLRRDSHPRPSPYEGAALLLRHRAVVGRLGNAPSSAG